MYCDLCLSPSLIYSKEDVSKNISSFPSEFLELIASSISDSYSILGINKIIRNNISEDKCSNFPLILLDNKNLKNVLDKTCIKFLNKCNVNLINLEKISLLKRVTLEISEQKDLFQLSTNSSNNLLNNYDLISIKPLNDIILESCLTGDLNFDIITLNLDIKFNFLGKKNLIQSAIKKGIFFEFLYGDYISKEANRAGFNSNFLIFNEIVKGDNIIFSSGASNIFEQRSPYDICVLLETVFGIKQDIAKKMISENSLKAVLKSKQRKFFKRASNSYYTK